MELRGKFLPQFEVQYATTLTSRATKRFPISIVNIYSRESFPAQYYGLKNLEVHSNNDHSIRHLAFPQNEGSKLPELSFDRLQLTDEECTGLQRRNFGRFVAREAILDEEYWTAAWLRAEAHWESLSYMRHVNNYKRKYAEQEFYALKRRCSGQEGSSLNCFCFLAVKKEDKNVRRTVLNSIVGTLDLSIRHFLQGETYPGEIKKPSSVLASQGPFDTEKYAYIANVCVAKFARRQGIASNMLYLATDVATMLGIKQLFVHVNTDNQGAQDLYRKTGFKVFEIDSSPSTNDQMILMSIEL